MKRYNITTLPGDGIGPEITASAVEILKEISKQSDIEFNITEKQIGGKSIDLYSMPLTDEALDACLSSDSVFLGAVGGPKWDNVDHEIKPEQALLKLRKSLSLYSNLRPANIFKSLINSSSLKPNIIDGTDIMIVRELTGGIYFGSPRGLDAERGWNTLEYTKKEVERIALVSFKLAQSRSKNLVSVHKSNVLESSQFWQNIIHEIHQDYPDVTLSDMYVDNAAMQIIQNPKQFDVIVTQNLFGDILSDISAMITGSLGMLPSASVGDNFSMYEPVHGSAPDLAGKNIANPIASILSIAMMMGITFKDKTIESNIYQAVSDALGQGYGTPDIVDDKNKHLSTTEFTELVKEQYRKLITKKD
ncbi:MAG: 3-isopropylmalate dehydrogenase [Candidatus Neomarinimicrobiota bacterium]